MSPARTRREPPPFRPVEVARVEPRSPHLWRVTLTGPGLEGFDLGLPASSVRLLLPDLRTGELELPTWNGNEWLTADGRRPPVRTLTPLRFEPDTPELDVEVVLHGEAPLTSWARGAQPGTPAALSGTGRGYEVDAHAERYVLAGDESALPAISTLLPHLPVGAEVQVLLEVRAPDARVDLPLPDRADIAWLVAEPGTPPGDAMVGALAALELATGVRVWAAGEAAAVQRIRRYLFQEVGLERRHTSVRGYWKEGRAGAEG